METTPGKGNLIKCRARCLGRFLFIIRFPQESWRNLTRFGLQQNTVTTTLRRPSSINATLEPGASYSQCVHLWMDAYSGRTFRIHREPLPASPASAPHPTDQIPPES